MDTTLGRDRVREFVDLILESMREDTNEPDLPAKACLSRYHFDRLVSSATGEAPGKFRRRLLLERAAWQLQSTADSITWIGMAADYRSVEGFTRAFARAFGLSPARFRKSGQGFRIGAPNGVHFRPPGGITLPGVNDRSKRMDFVDRIIEHDIWFTSRLLNRAGQLASEALDRPTSQTWRWQSENGQGPTLRELLNQLVANKENWVASMAGKPAPSEDGDGVEVMKSRYDAASKEYLGLIREVKRRGAWDEGFVDALCDPPETFTYGGMLAHVTTFCAFRRTMAIFAFRELGVDDLGLGDPMEWERSLQ